MSKVYRLELNSVDVYGEFKKTWVGNNPEELYNKAYNYLKANVGNPESFYKDLELFYE